MREIAHEVGVSTATVSRALNSPERVRPNVRDDAAHERAGLLPRAQFVERQERIPMGGLINPPPSALADVALRHFGVDGPGQGAGMLELHRRSRADFERHQQPFHTRR